MVILTADLLAIFALTEPDRSRYPENGGGDGNGERGGYETFVLDVAVDGRTFAPHGLRNIAPDSKAPNHQPVRGTTFIINGLILPGYSLCEGPGVMVDDYSAASIGTWLCRGRFIYVMMVILTEGGLTTRSPSFGGSFTWSE